jgi:hypothetical protein
MMNEALRTAIAADLAPVRPLAPPHSRVLPVVPLALLLLVAAPVVFDLRELSLLGWMWSWGASTLQMMVGLAIIALALRESVPGRSLPARLLVGTVAGVALLLIAVTAAAWSLNPVSLARYWWQIGAMCAVGSATSALPAVVLSAVLIVRAYPVRPALAGGIAGLGGGLLADAGWRLFCHFSEPAHVIAAHLGGVVVAAIAGAVLTSWLAARGDSQIPGYTPR